ncbi:SAM-dependent chlorinase/fluorinase [Pleurocapsales cyanobacterium LEGE 06147]|nr:SAM-dependent chlorinase/fluorinase [Pleurocapsales cyanobacterium LEGE 06147]
MSANGIITLLTDFGWQDVYVGVMKGAIASINSQLQAIDLTHEIPPQNIAAARFCLLNAYTYFPSGTVHIAVVDPGVGSQRRGVAIQFADGFLVGPDNGLFSGVLNLSPAIAAVELTNTDYWRTPNPSTTFHGRDIFAPVGAHLASGVSLEQLGNSIDPDSLVKLTLPELTITDNKIIGCIQYCDRFGNLITNIPADAVIGQCWSAIVENRAIPTVQTYSDVPKGEIAALIGSHGWIEIAVNGGSAREKLQLDCADAIEIKKF